MMRRWRGEGMEMPRRWRGDGMDMEMDLSLKAGRPMVEEILGVTMRDYIRTRHSQGAFMKFKRCTYV